jgi:tetratricopeptide (TPR) repeat protein
MIAETAVSILAFIGQAHSPAQANTWPSAMGYSKVSEQSPFVQRVSKILEQPARTLANASAPSTSSKGSPDAASASQSPPSQILGATDSTPETDARLDAYLSLIDNEADRAKALIAKGDVDAARTSLETFLQTYPEPYPAIILMDLDMSHGDYIDAYKVAAPFMRHGGGGSNELMLRASLAAAKLGEVYPGQLEYCLQQIGYGDWAKFVPQGDSPKIVAALSNIAIAERFGADYHSGMSNLQDALHVDPTNPWICRWLSDFYVARNYDYSDAIKLIELSLQRLPKGNLREEVLIRLSDLRSYYRKVGDGRPAWPIRPPIAANPSSTIHP